MTTFAVTNSNQLLPAVNYLLSNLDTTGAGNVTIPGNVLVANTTTGVVSQAGNASVFGYLYQYVNLRYSNNAIGTAGFDTNSNNYSYFGVHNSVGPTPSSNPTAYQWYEVSPPFNTATNRTLYYSAIGGRQIQWAAASSPPSSNFQITTANVAIDLDVVTTATGTPGERGPLGMAYVITTANPGNASSATLTGWFSSSRTANTPPIGTGLSPPVPGDTAYFTYPTTGQSSTFSYNGSVWNSVVGQVVSGDTLVANSVPGSSLAANTITGDKINANTITANNIQTGTLTTNLFTANSISANILTANTFAANTISGQAIDSGSITTDKLAANVLIANTVISTGATIGNFASPGFWLQGNTGNARFGNTVSIGNNLTIGNNAVIGGNLSVSGLVTSGGLNANTVNTQQVVPNAISETPYVLNNSGNAYVWNPGPVGSEEIFYVPGVSPLANATGVTITLTETTDVFASGYFTFIFQPGDTAPFTDNYYIVINLRWVETTSGASVFVNSRALITNTNTAVVVNLNGNNYVAFPLAGASVPAGTWKLVMQVTISQQSGARWTTSLFDMAQIGLLFLEFKR
jgi:hypothetical protein